MNEIDKVYCPLPFRALAFKEFINGKLSGATPCCMMLNTLDDGFEDTTKRFEIPNVENLTPDEIFNSERMKELRQNILNGKRDSACKVCWQAEDRGVKSYREYMKADEVNFEPKLREIDLSISNVCNLACRMCAPTNSNLLQKDHKFFKDNGKYGEILKATNGRWYTSFPYDGAKSKQWQWIVENIQHLETLKMSGGEPFYDRKVIDLLQMCVDKGYAKDISLEFHTNTICFDDKIIGLLKEFKNRHTFSIDGVGKVYEYIRHPATFEQLDASLQLYVKHMPQKMLHINYVVSILNVFSTIDFLDYMESLNVEYHVFFSEVFPNTRGTGLRHLSYDLLEQAHCLVLDNFDKYGKETMVRLEQVVKNAKEKCNTNQSLALKEVKLFDESRNQSYEDYLDKRICEWLNGK